MERTAEEDMSAVKLLLMFVTGTILVINSGNVSLLCVLFVGHVG